MFSIVIPELIILLIIVILLLGPDRIGRGIRGFHKSLQGQSQTAVQHEPPEDKENKSN
jgi:Sec-independent protein translocase protein TatA